MYSHVMRSKYAMLSSNFLIPSVIYWQPVENKEPIMVFKIDLIRIEILSKDLYPHYATYLSFISDDSCLFPSAYMLYVYGAAFNVTPKTVLLQYNWTMLHKRCLQYDEIYTDQRSR